MATVTELTVAEELDPLWKLASQADWELLQCTPIVFLLGLRARDGQWFYVSVDCADYPANPPAWHWCDSQGTSIDELRYAPQGSGFLHPNAVICAPWNRLAYQTVSSRGPHGDWQIGDWKNNPYTKGCVTLAAMALRLSVELMSDRYTNGRMG
jgi:hypothetical protein